MLQEGNLVTAQLGLADRVRQGLRTLLDWFDLDVHASQALFENEVATLKRLIELATGLDPKSLTQSIHLLGRCLSGGLLALHRGVVKSE